MSFILHVWVYQNILVIQLVIVIFKMHRTPLKLVRLLKIHLFFELSPIVRVIAIEVLGGLEPRNPYTFLQEVSCGYRCVCKELPEILYFLSPFNLFIRVFVSPNIRVSRTVINHMTEFLAAITPHILQMFALGLELAGLIFLILVVFALMLGELTSGLFLAPLTAAPPHLASVDSSMGPATPVEVLFLVVLLSAHLTHLDALVHLSLSTLKLHYSLLHFLPLCLEHLVLLVKLHALVNFAVQVLGQLLDALLQLGDGSLGHHRELDLLPICPLFDVDHILDHVSEVITLPRDHLELLFKVHLLVLDGIDEIGLTINLQLEFVLQILRVRDGVDTFVKHAQLVLHDFVTDGGELLVLAKLKDLIGQFIVLGQSFPQLLRETLPVEL
jgi:hypothetical protein